MKHLANGNVLGVENEITRRKAWPSSNLYITNTARFCVESSASLRGKKPVNNCTKPWQGSIAYHFVFQEKKN